MKKKIQTYIAQKIANLIYWYCVNSKFDNQFKLGYSIGMYLNDWATERDIWLE